VWTPWPGSWSPSPQLKGWLLSSGTLRSCRRRGSWGAARERGKGKGRGWEASASATASAITNSSSSAQAAFTGGLSNSKIDTRQGPPEVPSNSKLFVLDNAVMNVLVDYIFTLQWLNVWCIYTTMIMYMMYSHCSDQCPCGLGGHQDNRGQPFHKKGH